MPNQYEAATSGWSADAATNVVGFGGAGWVSNVGGLAGTSGLFESTGEGRGVRFNGRAVAGTTLKVMSACASGVSTFASSTTAGGGAVAGVILGSLGDALSGGLQAYDAQKCRAELERCIDLANDHCPEDEELINALEACVAKQNIKFRTGVGKATIIGQPGVAIYRTGKAIYKAAKGTKGKGRRERAELLIGRAKNDKGWSGRIARFAIGAIMGMQYDKIATNAVAEAMKSS